MLKTVNFTAEPYLPYNEPAIAHEAILEGIGNYRQDHFHPHRPAAIAGS